MSFKTDFSQLGNNRKRTGIGGMFNQCGPMGCDCVDNTVNDNCGCSTTNASADSCGCSTNASADSCGCSINASADSCGCSTNASADSCGCNSEPDVEYACIKTQRGPAGPQGPQGVPGPAGGRGPAGRDGCDGRDGCNGPTGPRGSAGCAGPQGPQGPQGPAGCDGRDGARGPQGPQGLRGQAGAPGTDASQDVLSAFDPTERCFEAGEGIPFRSDLVECGCAITHASGDDEFQLNEPGLYHLYYHAEISMCNPVCACSTNAAIVAVFNNTPIDNSAAEIMAECEIDETIVSADTYFVTDCCGCISLKNLIDELTINRIFVMIQKIGC